MVKREPVVDRRPDLRKYGASTGVPVTATSPLVSPDCFYSTAWVDAEGLPAVSLPGPHLLLSSSAVDVDVPEGWVSRVVVDAVSLRAMLVEQAWGCVAVLSEGQESDVVLALRVLQACAEGEVSSPSRLVFLPLSGAVDDAGLWGLARTAQFERPDLAVHCVEASRAQLLRALTLSQSDGLEEEYRFTDLGILQVPRLRRHSDSGGDFAARPEVTYVVSGGLGALGLVVAEFLVDGGAQHVVLLSRSAGADSVVSPRLAELRRTARIECLACDVSDLPSVHRARDAMARAGMPAVAGVVHAAGVVTDGVLANQSESKLMQAFGAKVSGAKNLRGVFAPSDFLVLFSSAASMFGPAGQASCVAANTTLGALAESWSKRGEPVLAIQWGVWSDAGMAVRHDAVGRATASGCGAIDNELGTMALSRLLAGPERGTVCVSPIDWDAVSLESPFVSHFATRRATEPPVSDPGDVRQAVRRLTWEVAGRPVEDHDVLSESGLDSLGSVLLRKKIATDLKVVLPMTLVSASSDIDSLVQHVTERMPSRSSVRTPTTQRSGSPQLPILVIGAGLGGIGFARTLERLGVATVVLEKRDRIGGVWSALANTHSKLQIDSPAYSFDSVLPTAHGDQRWLSVFPGKDEVLQQARAVSAELAEPVHLNCEVLSVRKVREQEYEAVYRQEGVIKSIQVSGVAAFTGALHRPVVQHYRGEHLFAGHIGLGIADDTLPANLHGASVVVVGHGAFAVENMRTALENGARHVTIVCRSQNLVVSSLCSWLVNSNQGATLISDVVEMMRPFYDLCGMDVESIPSLSQDADGNFVLDQSTVPPASDVYFLAQALGKLTVIEDEIATVSTHSVTTRGGKEVSADVLVKCLGSHTDRTGLLTIFGEGSRVDGLWINGDPNLMTYNDRDQVPRKIGSILCSSYAFFVQAFAEAYLHYRANPDELAALRDRISSDSSGKSPAERLIVELWQFIGPAKRNVASRTVALCPFDRFQSEREAEWRAYAELMGGPAGERDGFWRLMSPALSLIHRRDPSVPVERRVRHDDFGPVNIFVPRRHRVLFLPERGTNGRLSRAMLTRAGWSKREDLEFVIPDAPYAMPAVTHREQLEVSGLDWLAEDGLYDAGGSHREWNAGFLELWNEYYGTPVDADSLADEDCLSAALRYIRSIAEDHGPFAGVAGFGEGAAVVSAALHSQARGHEVGLGEVRFFLAMSAWRSPVHERAGLFEKSRPIEIPVLQTLGEKEPDVFLAAAPIFRRDFRTVFEHRHPGRHVFPPLTSGLDQKLNRLLHAACVRVESGT